MNDLLQAIDNVVAFVNDHKPENAGYIFPVAELPQLRELADRVYDLCLDANLLTNLPSRTGQQPIMYRPIYNRRTRQPQTVHFETSLNIPGDVDGENFLAYPADWLKDMETLRAIAERQVRKMPNVGSAGDVSLDARALAIFLENRDLTKKQIANRLGLKHTQSLSPARCPQLSQAMATQREIARAGRRNIRGCKDQHGSLEAYADDDE